MDKITKYFIILKFKDKEDNGNLWQKEEEAWEDGMKALKNNKNALSFKICKKETIYTCTATEVFQKK